jgi:ATP-binding cassette subfamily B protein
MKVDHEALELRYHAAHPWKTLLGLLDAPWHVNVRILFFFIIKTSPALLFPVFAARVIQIASHPASTSPHEFIALCVIYFLCILQNPVTHYYFLLLTSRRIRSIERRLRAAVARQLQSLTLSYHSSTDSGRLQAKVLRDVEDITNLANNLYNVLLETLIAFSWVFLLSFFTDPIVGLFFLILTPVMILLSLFFRKKMRKSNRDYREGMEALSAGVHEMIEMIPVTRAHGMEQKELERMEGRLGSVFDKGIRLDIINGFFSSFSWVSMRACHFALLVFTGWLAYYGRFSFDKVVLYNGLFVIVMMNIFGLLTIYPMLTRGFDAIRSLGELLESTDLEENENKAVVDRVEGAVEFNSVTFQYEQKQAAAVHDFSIRVRPGECIAFVGESGAGKSTLMNLTLGFWRPQKGRILLDGRDMAELDMRTYRRFVAVVPQQTILFSGTLRENIAYGVEEATDAQIAAAVQAAHLGAFIESLPLGIATLVGKNGLKLSGGQRQRVAIARALIRDPRLIILDEATSALDVVSEQEVQAALEALVHGRTTFIVAHRLSTIRMADRIVVMKAGRAIELGTADDLNRPGTEFHRLKSLQS